VACILGIIGFLFIPSDPEPKPRLVIGRPPSFLKVDSAETLVGLSILNRGNAVADSLKDLELTIIGKGEVENFREDAEYSSLPDDKVIGYPEGGVAINIPFITPKLFSDSAVVVFLRIAYQDGKGNADTPLREFIKIPKPKQGEVIPEVSREEEISLRQLMQQKGYW